MVVNMIKLPASYALPPLLLSRAALENLRSDIT